MSWAPVGRTPETDLQAARLQLHHALQIPAAVGNRLLDARPDWSHLSFSFEDRGQALLSEPVGPSGLRVGLRFEDLCVLLVRPEGERVATVPLVGLTLTEGLAALQPLLVSHAGIPADSRLVPPAHELPDHPVAHGARFAIGDPAARAELASWYANLEPLLVEIEQAYPGVAAPVRCWPEHFDIATLLTFDTGRTAEPASINCGMSPGDAGITAPYVYVTPWPAPGSAPQLSLAHSGEWHVRGWTGALLTSSSVAQKSDPEELVRGFLRSGLEACQTILGL